MVSFAVGSRVGSRVQNRHRLQVLLLVCLLLGSLVVGVVSSDGQVGRAEWMVG